MSRTTQKEIGQLVDIVARCTNRPPGKLYAYQYQSGCWALAEQMQHGGIRFPYGERTFDALKDFATALRLIADVAHETSRRNGEEISNSANGWCEYCGRGVGRTALNNHGCCAECEAVWKARAAANE